MKQSVRFRAASAAAKQPQPRETQPEASAAAQPLSQVSFANDIVPIFKPYQEPMMWRLDLTSYDAVRANAHILFHQIATHSMPPPPIQPLTAAQIATFKAWMDEGFPP